MQCWRCMRWPWGVWHEHARTARINADKLAAVGRQQNLRQRNPTQTCAACHQLPHLSACGHGCLHAVSGAVLQRVGIRCRACAAVLEAVMSRAVWHKGPPPSVGWWPASTSRSDGIFRWWNGVFWSRPVSQRYSKTEAAYTAGLKSQAQNFETEWKHRPKSWPARSRT